MNRSNILVKMTIQFNNRNIQSLILILILIKWGRGGGKPEISKVISTYIGAPGVFVYNRAVLNAILHEQCDKKRYKTHVIILCPFVAHFVK